LRQRDCKQRTADREAIAAGWKDFAHMQKDPALAPLRDLPKFKALRPRTDSNEKE
jgi:hypothetical protein